MKWFCIVWAITITFYAIYISNRCLELERAFDRVFEEIRPDVLG